MPIIGYDTIAANSAATAANWRHEAYRNASGLTYVASSGDAVTEVAVYGDGTGSCTVGLYTVNGSGNVDALVAQQTVTIGASAGWHTASVSWSLTASVEYTVAIRYEPDLQGWNIRYDNAAVPTGGTSSSTALGSDAFPDPWSENSTGNAGVSFYATVTAGSLSITPTGPTVTVSAGTLTVTPPAQAVSPTGPTVTVSAGTVTVSQVTPISVTGPTVTATPGTLTVATTGTVPAAVVDLAGTAGNAQVVLTWSAPDDGGSTITDYVVQYRVAVS